MTLAATFLGGAKGRLLPPSIPLRFFAAAAAFHVLLWAVSFAAMTDLPNFRGGPGPALATIHLLTLGVLTTAAIGAATQLLPVATRRALAAVWPIKLVFWLTVSGMAGLIYGMYAVSVPVLVPGAIATTIGLLLFAALLADNLSRAASLAVVAAYGWVALFALVALVILAVALALDHEIGFLPAHPSLALAHFVLGSFGFMGFLVLGFSHVFVPMFALASAPAKIPAFAGFGLAAAALLLGTSGALIDDQAILAAASMLGLGAASLHLRLMTRVLATGMRKRLGLSFILVRIAWAMLPIALLVGLAALYGFAGPNGPALFGLLLIGGWLLTFLMGILQRILPFLASMHVGRPMAGSAPLVSEFAGSTRLKLHAVCHCAGIALLAASIIADNAALGRLGAAIGLIGAVAFAWFTADIVMRVLAAAPARAA